MSNSKKSGSTKEDIKNLEKKLGEVLGLERAAQKAVDELVAMKLLDSGDKDETKEIQDEANSHEEKLLEVVNQLANDEEIKINIETVNDTAKETEKKATKIMKTYLGENPDKSEGLEFLCLAEGGEVAHYEVLEVISKKFNNRKLRNTVRSILRQERGHLTICLDMAREAVS